MNNDCCYSESVFTPDNTKVTKNHEEAREKWEQAKGLALYMVSPEDTTEKNVNAGMKYHDLTSGPDYVGMAKTVFWIAVSVMLPIALLQL